MAKHIRQQVREAAKTDLSGIPGIEKVFSGRTAPIKPNDMPCLNILLLDENADWDSIPNIARTGRLIIEGRLQGNERILDDLDDMAVKIETRIYGSTPELEGLLQRIDPPTTQIDLPEAEEGNSRRTGIIRILFPVTYRTSLTNPTMKV